MDEFEARLEAKLERSLKKVGDDDTRKKLLRDLYEHIKQMYHIEKEISALPPEQREELEDRFELAMEEHPDPEVRELARRIYVNAPKPTRQ